MSDADTPKIGEEKVDESAEFPLPPATFGTLVSSLVIEAQMALGLLHFGEEKDAPKADLRRAQYSIDLLAMLEEKTRGNLALEEHRFLENNLTELRFRYVQAAEQRAK